MVYFGSDWIFLLNQFNTVRYGKGHLCYLWKIPVSKKHVSYTLQLKFKHLSNNTEI